MCHLPLQADVTGRLARLGTLGVLRTAVAAEGPAVGQRPSSPSAAALRPRRLLLRGEGEAIPRNNAYRVIDRHETGALSPASTRRAATVTLEW